jgi:hypothetical protein
LTVFAQSRPELDSDSGSKRRLGANGRFFGFGMSIVDKELGIA